MSGLWDSLLGEGRRRWITAPSDSHVHWTRAGADSWPGEYRKTYVLARQDYGDIMDGLRHRRIWVTTVTSSAASTSLRGARGLPLSCNGWR